MIKILVVDDETEARELIADTARVEGSEVSTAQSTEEAIRAITDQSFDLIITDMKLGHAEQGGLEVLRAAKQKDKYTQVIVITAYGTPQISVTAMSLGAFDYLEKEHPGIKLLPMIRSKIPLALDYRNAKRKESNLR